MVGVSAITTINKGKHLTEGVKTMARKIPETVYITSSLNHRGERVNTNVFAFEHLAAGRVNIVLSLNENTCAEYKAINREDIPRGFKSKIIFR